MKKYIIPSILICQALLLSIGIGSISSFDSLSNVQSAYASERVVESATGLKEEAPNDLKELQAASDEQLDRWAKLQKFDGRDYNYVTPQKPQGRYLVCWAFAATGLAEISVLRQGLAPEYDKNTLDFDDLHVAWASKNMDKSSNPLNLMKDDVSPNSIVWNDGDSVYSALYSMTDGFSPIPQQPDDQFRTTIPSQYIAEQVIRVEPTQDAIKKAVLKYGGVAFSYEPGTYTSYMCSKAPRTSHVSIIVGWDDNFDKDTHPFLPDQPDKNGAWVVKNSWSVDGADQVGDIGACYLSYEAHIGYRFAVDMGLKSDYPNIYQYDGSSVDSSSSVPDIGANAAIFEAKLSDPTQQEYLKAIQVGFKTQDVNLQVEIYKLTEVNPANVNDEINNPTNGELIHRQSVYFAKDGFYIINLNREILLEQGEYFSIVLYDKTKKDLKVICGLDVHSTNDMTYYRQGDVWRSYKYSTSFLYANEADIKQAARIRAITDTKERDTPLDDKNLQYARIEIDNRLMFYKKGMVQNPKPTVYMGNTVLAEGRDYLVKAGNNILPGKVDIKITGINNYHGTRTTMFEIAKPYRPDNVPRQNITVYNNVKSLAGIHLPEGWNWLEGQQLNAGQNTYTIKYIAEDNWCYLNTFFDIIINKLDAPPPEQIDISTAIIEIDGEYTYNEEKITPTINVIFDKQILSRDIDYIISYSNNINAGTAYVTISGIGLYKGSRTQSFAIGKAKCPPNMPQSEMEVSRKAVTLSEIAHLLPIGWTWESGQTPITDGMTATAVYEDQTNYENYTATITVRLLSQVDIGSLNADYDRKKELVYDGNPMCPEVYILDGLDLLTKNEDFIVAYQNNIEAGEGRIIITGTGNCYYGEITLTFPIRKAQKPDIPTKLSEITVPSSAERYRDIGLPPHWEWKTADALLDRGNNTATIMYDDSRNYEQTEFEIKLIFEPAPTESADILTVIYGVAGSIGGVSIISALIFVLIKRKQV